MDPEGKKLEGVEIYEKRMRMKKREE